MEKLIRKIGTSIRSILFSLDVDGGLEDGFSDVRIDDVKPQWKPRDPNWAENARAKYRIYHEHDASAKQEPIQYSFS